VEWQQTSCKIPWGRKLAQPLQLVDVGLVAGTMAVKRLRGQGKPLLLLHGFDSPCWSSGGCAPL